MGGLFAVVLLQLLNSLAVDIRDSFSARFVGFYGELREIRYSAAEVDGLGEKGKTKVEIMRLLACPA